MYRYLISRQDKLQFRKSEIHIIYEPQARGFYDTLLDNHHHFYFTLPEFQKQL